MDLLANYFSESFVYALGWTFIHSFWQAAIIALIMLLLLNILRDRSAKFRYEAAAFSLFTVLVSAVVTFIYLYEQSAVTLESIATPEHFTFVGEGSSSEYIVQSWLNSIAGFFNEHLAFVVLFWGLGFLFFSAKLVGGYLYVQRLRQSGDLVKDRIWLDKLNQLTSNIRLSSRVELLVSSMVSVPVVMGYFKPVILLPFSALNQLTAEEVESILAHELAHIYRNDYILNIFFSFIEALFYYNPAVWFIAAHINTEREHCCDDVAIKLCGGNSLQYAKALVKLQTFQRELQPALALSAVGHKHQLLNRVKRILNQPQNKTNIREKMVASCLLLVTVLIFSVGASLPAENVYTTTLDDQAEELFPGLVLAEGENPEVARLKEKIAREKLEQPHLLPSVEYHAIPQQSIWLLEEERHNAFLKWMEIQTKHEAPKTIKFDDRVIWTTGNGSTDQLQLLSKENEAKLLSVNLNKGRHHIDVDTISPEYLEILEKHAQEVEELKAQMAEMEKQMKEDYLVQIEAYKAMAEEYAADAKESAETRAALRQAEAQAAQERNRMMMTERGMRLEVEQTERVRAQAEVAREQAERIREEVRINVETHQHQQQQHEKQMQARAIERELRAKKHQEFSDRLITKLKKDGLIKSKDKIKFELSNSKLKVNGKTMSKALHKEYLKFYEKYQGKSTTRDFKYQWSKS